MVEIIDKSLEYDYAVSEDVSLDKLFELNSKIINDIKYYRQTDSLSINNLLQHIHEFNLNEEDCIIIIAKDEISKRNPAGLRYILYCSDHTSFSEFVSHMQ